MFRRILLIVGCASFLLACPGNLDTSLDSWAKPGQEAGVPPKKDTGGNPPPKLDKGGNPPPKLDKGGWPPPPDQKIPPDQYQPPPDKGYTPSPFGCTVDAECFGLKCCATPWGVKLCSNECTW